MVQPSRRIARIVTRYVKAAAELGIHPEAVYLFGSYARGEARRYSDIDLAVVWRGFRRLGYIRSYEVLGRVAGKIMEPVQAIPYTPQQFANPVPGGFLEAIQEDCVPVFRAEAPTNSPKRPNGKGKPR